MPHYVEEGEGIVLEALRKKGPMTLGELASYLNWNQSETASILAKLVRRNLVRIRNLYEAHDA